MITSVVFGEYIIQWTADDTSVALSYDTSTLYVLDGINPLGIKRLERSNILLYIYKNM